MPHSADHPKPPETPSSEPPLKTLAAEKAGALETKDSVTTAANRMRENDAELWPVTEDRKLVGVIDEANPDCELGRHGHDPETWVAGQIMKPGAVFCYEDQDRCAARQLMDQHGLSHLPVVDREMRIVGIFKREELEA